MPLSSPSVTTRLKELRGHANVRTTMIGAHVLKGAVRESRVPSTIRRGEMKVFYTETLYPSASIADHDAMPCKYRRCAHTAGGVLYRDVAAQRCYEETI